MLLGSLFVQSPESRAQVGERVWKPLFAPLRQLGFKYFCTHELSGSKLSIV